MAVVSILHTIPGSIAPLETAFQPLAPEITLRHTLDQTILRAVEPDGSVDDSTQRRFLAAALPAAEGADVFIIACNVCRRFVPLLTPLLPIPVLAADGPMLQAAAALPGPVGILATKGPAAQVCRSALAALGGPDAVTQVVGEDEASITAAAQSCLEHGCTALILAQLSLSPAIRFLSACPVPVLCSPGYLAIAVNSLINERSNSLGTSL